jgi:O-Antigen ligase
MSTTAVTPRSQTWSVRRRPALALTEETDLARARTSALRWAVCAIPVIGVLVLWAADDGGYDSVTWLASGVGLTVLAIWSRIVFGAGQRLGRFGQIALVALALYVAWSFASIAWARDKGAALIGSDRALLYLLLFWLIAGLEWTRRRLELSFTLYVFGAGFVALATMVQLAVAPAPQLLEAGQLASPLGYHNATAALGTIGAAGAILIGSSASQRPAVRAGLAAVAVACLEVSLLANSRGWLYTLPVVAVILLALAPHRGRLVVWALIPACGALATLPWVAHSWALANGAHFGHQTVAGANETTAQAGLLAMVASAFVAWGLARGQRRYELSRRGRKWARRISHAFAALTVVAVAVAAAVAIQSGALARGWHQFATNAPQRAGVSRFAELGSGRYDMWRVAATSFGQHPLGGLGQDNFAQAYVASRRTAEEPTWVHSLELRLLAHTGIVGFLVFAAFLVCGLVAYRRAGRLGDSRLKFALAAALVPVTVWVVHGSVDWFWEMPALSGAAFVFLAAAVALESSGPAPSVSLPGRAIGTFVRPWRAVGRFGRPWQSPRTRAVGLASAAVAVLVLLGSAYLGERALGQGRALAATRPASALHELALAAKLEPYSSTPLALGAGLELRARHASDALRWAHEGLRRDAGDWVLWLEDGLAAGAAGQPLAEHAALARAHALDPREPVIALAQRRAGTHSPLTIAEAASMLASRAHARVAP